MKTFLKILLICISVVVFLAAIGVFVASRQMRPVDTNKTTRVTFTIPRGQPVATIGQRLQDAGIIRSALLFRFVVWQQNLRQKIQAGSFLLSPSMSISEVAQQLTLATNDTWIKILEGWRREEIADMLANQDLANFDKQDFLTITKNDEGYLFPDSYLIQKDADAKAIRSILRDTFEKKVTKSLASEITTSGRKMSDVVIMASIVQREARDFDQMKIVASILWNRVDAGMALNADSTLQYIKGYDPTQKTWWSVPLADDKNLPSLYNTYTNPGLPPGPIANPGLDAVRATIEAPKTDFLYYLHDSQGRLHYAKTLQEHNANVQLYLKN